ncbi:MAG: hypothetical protein F4X96_00190 [Gammaproteobacteria bacterium]|nr:hypothetical protein [Gammaproteobacteria bacterium]
MKQLKRWLEGSTIALLSWVLVGTLVLGVPAPVYATTDPHKVYQRWEQERAIGGPYVAYAQPFCSGAATGRGATALTAYRKSGGNAVSYEHENICHDAWGGWQSLEHKANNDWIDCRNWVDTNVRSVPGFEVSYDPEEAGYAAFLVIFATIIGAAVVLFGTRAENRLAVCGATLRG